jgi:hypothetical protein
VTVICIAPGPFLYATRVMICVLAHHHTGLPSDPCCKESSDLCNISYMSINSRTWLCITKWECNGWLNSSRSVQLLTYSLTCSISCTFVVGGVLYAPCPAMYNTVRPGRSTFLHLNHEWLNVQVHVLKVVLEI